MKTWAKDAYNEMKENAWNEEKHPAGMMAVSYWEPSDPTKKGLIVFHSSI